MPDHELSPVGVPLTHFQMLVSFGLLQVPVTQRGGDGGLSSTWVSSDSLIGQEVNLL